MAEKIILDTDPGVDDALALLLAHRHPAVDLIGVTTVFGNASIDHVTRNARFLKKRFGFQAPIAKGEAQALHIATHHWPIAVHGGDGLGDQIHGRICEHDLPPLDPRSAAQMIVDMARDDPGTITIIAVGRLTNLAHALHIEPNLPKLVKRVVVMGGAYALQGHNGNVTPVAEANMMGDPHAADIVLGAPWAVQIAGLDVTRKTVLTRQDFGTLATGDEACRFIVEATQGYLSYHSRFGVDGCYVHDSSAVVLAIAPELFTLRAGPIRVASDGVALGQTIQRDPARIYPPGAWDDRPDQHVATSVDSDAVKAMILKTVMPSIET